MSRRSQKSSDYSDSPVPWVSPRWSTGVPTGYRAILVFVGMIGVVALPYGPWTYLLGVAAVGAMAHQAVIDRRAASKREDARKFWDSK